MTDEFIYRVYDPQWSTYRTNSNGSRSTWLRKHHATRVCDIVNEPRHGTRAMLCVVHKFKLVRVEDKV